MRADRNQGALALHNDFELETSAQQKPVRIIHLVAERCLDERVMRVIGDKAATQDKLLNAVKELTK